MTTARRPSTTPSASISTQSFFTSAGFSERVVFNMGVPNASGVRYADRSHAASRVFLCGIHDTTVTARVPLPSLKAVNTQFSYRDARGG